MGKRKSMCAFFSVFKKGFVFFLVCQSVSIFVVSVTCHSQVSFTAVDVFEIPSHNSSIQFATAGTCENAFLEHDTWFFDELQFSVDTYSAEKLNLSVSAKDCNVTIYPFFMFNRSSEDAGVTSIFFPYVVEGQGTQTVNLGFDLQQGQIEAILDGEWIGLNHGWTRSDDGTITVTAPVSNVTLSFYGHPESYLDEPNLFEDHYVVIASSFLLAVIVGLATIIMHKKGTGET
jgi:hypothetical protein